jgi:L-threonylcarbamoyladenylate synthase
MDYKDDIKLALDVLERGGVILYPTDTIWGLGCDASSERGVETIYKVKERPASKSMVILVNSTDMLNRYVSAVHSEALKLIDHYSNPLTLVLPARENVVAPTIVSDDGYLGIRVCNEPFCQDLISDLGGAIVSTSANISGAHTPSIFDEVDPEIIRRADYTVFYRRDDHHMSQPSSVVKVDHLGNVTVLRA